MKKFLMKLLIFSFPILLFVGYVMYDVLVLPVDYYTFRAWEALSVYDRSPILSGPFYPNMHLVKTELGDLSGLTKLPVPKNVEWFTDQYGYRKENTGDKNFEIVVIGDSAIAGSSLTQDDMFTEKLGKRLGVNVYPYAPSDFNKFLEEERFRKDPPKIVIVESVEKLSLHLSEIPPEDQRKKVKSFSEKIATKFGLSETSLSKAAISIDRLKKQAFVNYLYARLEELPKSIFNQREKKSAWESYETEKFGSGKREEMVFYSDPKEYFNNWSESGIKRVIFTLNQYKDMLKETNTQLVFMPIPNKENIYWRQVTGGRTTTNLKRLIESTEKAGITTIDLWTVYNNLYAQNPDKLLYQTDDTHWNAYGVQVAVDQAVKKLNAISD